MRETAVVKDRLGLPISTGSRAAADKYIGGIDLLLSHNFGPEESFQQAIEADEGFALAHVGLATTLLFRVRLVEAKESVERARSLAAGISRRERQQIDALGLFLGGQGQKSFALIREHLAEYPRDALMLKLGVRLYILGCSGAGVASFPGELFDLLKGLEADYGDDWVFLSHYAFAHHEVGLTEEAFRLAERSLELSPTNAYAAHSVAHVYFETGEHSSGGDFLGGWLVGYDDRAPFHGHLSWHLALFELAMGRYQRVLELYQDNIRPSVLAKSAISLADSASLLWRMQMYTGSAPPAPWEEVVDQAAPAAEGPGPAFRDAHAALAFAASRDEEALERLTGRLRDLSEKGDLLAREVTLPLVEGIVSFAQGSYDEAVQSIEPACAQLTRIGGSHAQREVFEDTLLEAYLRAEQFESAEGMLRRRLIRRTSVRDLFWMGRAQASDGQPEEASSSLSQATQRWASADPRCPELRALKELVDKVAG